VSLQSLNIEVRIIFTTNKLVDRISNLKSNDDEAKYLFNKCAAGQIYSLKKCAEDKTYQKKMRRRLDFLT